VENEVTAEHGVIEGGRREVTYARLSVTERCNLSCAYCRPERGTPGSGEPCGGFLSVENAEFLARAAAEVGVRRVRLTGGEPLLHPAIEQVALSVRSVPGIEEVLLTTNGMLLERKAHVLAASGVKRVNVSLDSLVPGRFRAVTGTDGLARVLAGLDAALDAGLNPVKINVVVMRGLNSDELVRFAEMTCEREIHVRFIEVMPLGNSAFYRPELLVPTQEVMGSLGELEPAQTEGLGPARVFKLRGALGTVGFIAPMTDCFCAACNRVRLTSRLCVYPCLASDFHVDVSRQAQDSDVAGGAAAIRQALAHKAPRHEMGGEKFRPDGRICSVGG